MTNKRENANLVNGSEGTEVTKSPFYLGALIVHIPYCPELNMPPTRVIKMRIFDTQVREIKGHANNVIATIRFWVASEDPSPITNKYARRYYIRDDGRTAPNNPVQFFPAGTELMTVGKIYERMNSEYKAQQVEIKAKQEEDRVRKKSEKEAKEEALAELIYQKVCKKLSAEENK
jgi:hypothetical protein